MTDVELEYATDHVPQNTQTPLRTPEKWVPQPKRLSHGNLIATAVLALRAQQKREPAARAHRLRNCALELQRMSETDEEWEAMREAAFRLWHIAEEISPIGSEW